MQFAPSPARDIEGCLPILGIHLGVHYGRDTWKDHQHRDLFHVQRSDDNKQAQ
jgi:hypothetical protein